MPVTLDFFGSRAKAQKHRGQAFASRSLIYTFGEPLCSSRGAFAMRTQSSLRKNPGHAERQEDATREVKVVSQA
jgi:hypothetical protein